MNPPSISPGSYEGFQYWTLSENDGQLRIEAGRVPWGMIVLVELILGAMGGVMLHFARGHWDIAVPMAGILTLVLLANVLLPLKAIRDQRRLGPILVHHADRQQLELPRKGCPSRSASWWNFAAYASADRANVFRVRRAPFRPGDLERPN